MPDYGHDLMFGAMLEPERAADAVALAVLAEQAGLDAVSLADHPYWPERLDTFALVGVHRRTHERVRVFPNLANLPLRPPPMLARTAATMDVLSDGRFELGIGTGAQQMWDAIVAEGGPRRDAAESIDALDEAVQVIRALWTTGPDVSVRWQALSNRRREAGTRTGTRHRHLVGCLPAEDAWVGWTRRRRLGTQFALPAARTAPGRQPDHRCGCSRRRPVCGRGASHLQHRRRIQRNGRRVSAGAACESGSSSSPSSRSSTASAGTSCTGSNPATS